MFIEKIIKKDEKITITVRVEKVRKFSFEKKEVYRKNVEDLIREVMGFKPTAYSLRRMASFLDDFYRKVKELNR